MTEKVEKLKRMVEEKLSHAHNELEKAKIELESCYDKTRADLECKIDQVRDELNSKKHTAKETRARLHSEFVAQKARVEARIKDLKESTAQRKEERAKKRIVTRADKAEHLAETCIDAATVAIIEAELACLEACRARADAEQLVETSS
jgi:hypothetical protein